MIRRQQPAPNARQIACAFRNVCGSTHVARPEVCRLDANVAGYTGYQGEATRQRPVDRWSALGPEVALPAAIDDLAVTPGLVFGLTVIARNT